MAALIKPKEFIVTSEDGEQKTFILSNFDAVAGREIIVNYPTSALPKIGDYKVNEEMMLKLMSYVGIPREDASLEPLRLTTKALINTHVGDWETLAKIEMAMLEKNASFFRDGRSFDFFERATQMILQKITEMLMASSEPSSPAEKPPSTNLEPSTT